MSSSVAYDCVRTERLQKEQMDQGRLQQPQ